MNLCIHTLIVYEPYSYRYSGILCYVILVLLYSEIYFYFPGKYVHARSRFPIQIGYRLKHTAVIGSDTAGARPVCCDACQLLLRPDGKGGSRVGGAPRVRLKSKLVGYLHSLGVVLHTSPCTREGLPRDMPSHKQWMDARLISCFEWMNGCMNERVSFFSDLTIIAFFFYEQMNARVNWWQHFLFFVNEMKMKSTRRNWKLNARVNFDEWFLAMIPVLWVNKRTNEHTVGLPIVICR